jgi:hypothetical protein
MSRNTQRKGDTATTQAIATFTKLGYDVSLPVTESAKYDLIVDIEGDLKRVQVKYSTRKGVELRMVHSNTKGSTKKKALENDYDWLYVLHPTNDSFTEHLIKECLVGRSAVHVNDTNILKEVL